MLDDKIIENFENYYDYFIDKKKKELDLNSLQIKGNIRQ